MIRKLLLTAVFTLGFSGATLRSEEPAPSRDTHRGDQMIGSYFRRETGELARRCLADIRTADDWKTRSAEYRRQLLDMLGLDPLPERTPLQAETTGRVEHDEFVVEKVHFQSLPHLYVTGNLYLPKSIGDRKLPGILYVCGHGAVRKDGISYGNKVHYQHHGGWYARNGYACLIIDSLQLGEIEALHHGTYRENMWWWNSRGYTPAGVEAWNCTRALDYLQSRPEIDPEQLGVTGRSGGGAYSWWIAAIDDRIKAAVPTAGITDLENHVVDGKVEGHCDCMFMVNTYRWDYPQVAALVAPRPLLISNSDKDPIFPLEGVVRTHARARKVYDLLGAGKNLGLQITEGGHEDTQELHIHSFRWFNRFFRNDKSPVTIAAVPFFTPEQLKVFAQLPPDQINTQIQETFGPAAPPPAVPENAGEFRKERERVLAALGEKTFRGWPAEGGSLDVKPVFSAEHEGIRLSAYDFTSQPEIGLRLYVAQRAGLNPKDLDLVVLNALDEPGWNKFLATYRPAFADELKDEALPEANADEFASTQKMFGAFKWGMAYLAPRGIGRTAWDQTPKKQAQIRRRFMLLGQTLPGMQVWDVRRSVQALRGLEGFSLVPVWLQGEDSMAPVVLYASLFEPNIARLDLWRLPVTHREGSDFLNVLRVLDVPEAVALAGERSKVRIYQNSAGDWAFPQAVAGKLGWDPKQIQVRVVKPAEATEQK